MTAEAGVDRYANERPIGYTDEDVPFEVTTMQVRTYQRKADPL
jgi:hypothetical protein